MFAYCNNNPINYEDSSGCSLFPSTVVMNDSTGGDLHAGTTNSTDLQETNEKTKSAAVPNIIRYMNNTDENVVLEADYISFYKGVPVINVPAGNTASFSFGIIFLGSGNKSAKDGVSTLRHEYGHTVHLNQIGIGAYTSAVVIPSLIGFWSGIPYVSYYSQPWEYIADSLGGVNRTYLGQPYPYAQSAKEYSTAYWLFTLAISGG